MLIIAKTILAALLISFCSWLAGKKPELAGFIIALPLTTMLALAFTYAEWQDAKAAAAFARSVLVAVPVSLLFFVPFLMAERLQLNFWLLYGLGVILLAGGYFAHQHIMKVLQ